MPGPGAGGPPSRQATEAAFASWSALPFLGGIRTPTLVVCGTGDRVVPPVNSAVLARRIPGAELVLMPGGHDLQRRGPAADLARLVEPFLAGSDALSDGLPPRHASGTAA